MGIDLFEIHQAISIIRATVCRLEACDDISREVPVFSNLAKRVQTFADDKLQYITKSPNIEGLEVLAEIEINPLTVLGHGEGAVAVDVRVRVNN